MVSGMYTGTLKPLILDQNELEHHSTPRIKSLIQCMYSVAASRAVEGVNATGCNLYITREEHIILRTIKCYGQYFFAGVLINI